MSISTKPSILIILMGSLGDVARGLALVSGIKTHRPESRITWLVEPKCADLVSLHPQIDHIIVFNRQRTVSAMWKLFKELRIEHFDITLDLQRHFKSGFFSLLSGAKQRIGFHRRNAKELNWLFNNDSIPYFNENLSKLDHYLKFIEHLGLPEPESLDFGFNDLQIHQMIPPVVAEIQNTFLAVVMGSSWETKDWSFESYRDLVQQILKKQNRPVVLLGGSDQRDAAAKLIEKTDSSNTIDLTGNPLLELTAVLKAAAVAVGPDSGPGHLAAAVGTPYVTLFGPTPALRHVPYGCEHLVVQSDLGCAPCYAKQCPEGHTRCMETIEVEEVVEKISLALGGGEFDVHLLNQRH